MFVYCLKDYLLLITLMKLKMLVGILHINLSKRLSITRAVKYFLNQTEENVSFVSSWNLIYCNPHITISYHRMLG